MGFSLDLDLSVFCVWVLTWGFLGLRVVFDIIDFGFGWFWGLISLFVLRFLFSIVLCVAAVCELT